VSSSSHLYLPPLSCVVLSLSSCTLVYVFLSTFSCAIVCVSPLSSVSSSLAHALICVLHPRPPLNNSAPHPFSPTPHPSCPTTPHPTHPAPPSPHAHISNTFLFAVRAMGKAGGNVRKTVQPHTSEDPRPYLTNLLATLPPPPTPPSRRGYRDSLLAHISP